MQHDVTVYKVCMPAYYAWPPGKIILKVCYDKVEAEKYIQEYPNAFIRPWLSIETDVISVSETD